MDKKGNYICGDCAPEQTAVLQSVAIDVAKVAETTANEEDFTFEVHLANDIPMPV